MPTPRQHGGAPLQYFPLNLPGFRGLNKQARGSVLGPEWATRLENTVLDNSNRIASRKGFDVRTVTPVAGSFKQLIEFRNAGSYELIGVTDSNEIHRSTDGGIVWTDITGTATVSDPNMKLVIFNNTVLGFQDGADPVRYTGTGNFSTYSPAGIPQTNVALSSFGRLWVKDSDSVLKYCALLDESDWTGSDTGIFDLTSVWQVQDEITALVEFNNTLVVFAKENIVIYSDASGSVLGMDPISAAVVDVVAGIGCMARDSIASVKGDLWFLDSTGLHSLGRLVESENNPINNISANVLDELQEFVSIADPAAIRAAYSPQDRFYLLSLPAGGGASENGVAFCFDTRGILEDGSARCAGIWNQLVPEAMAVRDNLELMLAYKGAQGRTGRYALYQDNGLPYVLEYESGWTDLGTPALKILKRITGLLFIEAATSVSYKWAFDFNETFKSAQVLYPGSTGAAEWGSAEWNNAEWGGGARIREKSVAGRGTGEYVKVGFTIQINADEVSCQQIAMYAKEGRLK